MKVKSAELKKTRRKLKLKKYDLQMWSLMAIPLLLVFVFDYLPIPGIIIAFKNYRYDLGIFGSEWVGFDNFRYFFESDVFVRIVRNTVGMNLWFMLVSTVVAVLLAVLLFEVRSRNAVKVFQTVLITPNFISYVLVAYMVFSFLNTQYGMINVIRGKFGLETIDWYSEPKYWPFILTVTYIWKGIGMSAVTYYASLIGIDTSLFEAAEIDGANRVKVIWYIILPTLVPMVVIFSILGIGNIFRADFGLFYNVPRNVGLLYETTDVTSTFTFRTMRVIGDMGMSSAVGVLQSVVGIILVLTTNTIARKIDPNVALF